MKILILFLDYFYADFSFQSRNLDYIPGIHRQRSTK